MDFGDVWLALGIDLQVLQGALMHLYKNDPKFQVIEEAGAYRPRAGGSAHRGAPGVWRPSRSASGST